MAKEIVKTLCRMCDNRCGMHVFLEDGKVTGVEGNPDHPWNWGRLCSKGKAAPDIVNAPDRILKPLKKTPEGWREIPLEQALDEIAAKIREIQAKYGARAMSAWKGEALGFNQEEEMVRRFCHAIGTPNYFSNDSQCFVCRYMAYRFLYGTGAYPFPDYANAKCIVIWGANPPAAHPFMTRMVMEGKQNGARVVAVDPRLSMIARQAHDFIRILPGTDGALALGLIKILIENDWYDHDFVENHTYGFEELREYAARFDVDYVEKETGVSREEIEKLAFLLYKSSPHVSIYIGNGTEHHVNGVNNSRAIASLIGLCGALDRKGGSHILEGAGVRDLTLYEEKPLKHLGPIGADRFPVLYDQRHECHTMTAMETILSGDPYPLRGMILTGANPVSTNPNVDKVKKALASLDLFVVRELFMTETAQLAHYILPSATFMERTEVFCHAPLHLINLTPRVFSLPEVQDGYTFWHDLAHRLGAGEYFPWKDAEELNSWLLEPTGYTVEDLKAHPEGIVYKPLRYEKWKEAPLATSTGKVEFLSPYLKSFGLSELPEYVSPSYRAEPDPQYPYVLTTGARKLLFVHSRYHNIPRFHKACPEAEMEIHPEDAAELGIRDGESVVLESKVGALEMKARVVAENEIIKGCVHGIHSFIRNNVNRITVDLENDPISGFPLLKSIAVKISKIGGQPQKKQGPLS